MTVISGTADTDSSAMNGTSTQPAANTARMIIIRTLFFILLNFPVPQGVNAFKLYLGFRIVLPSIYLVSL